MDDTKELTEKLVRELEIIAFTDVNDFLVPGTTRLRDKSEIPEEKWRAVQEIKVEPGKGVTLKLYDRTKALNMLATYAGMGGEFNTAISTLNKYGLTVSRSPEGQWTITED